METKIEERKAERKRYRDVLAGQGVKTVVFLSGCSKVSIYNWLNGKSERTKAYPYILATVEALEKKAASLVSNCI